MSYISASDSAALHAAQYPAIHTPAHTTAMRHPSFSFPEIEWSVAGVLQVSLLLATSTAVSLVLCTAVVGALPN